MRRIKLCTFLLLCIVTNSVKCDADSSSSEDYEDSSSRIEALQEAARTRLKELMPTLEIHLQWALDLHFRDMQKASLIDQIDAKFQTKEIADDLRRFTDEFKKFEYWNFTDYDLKRQIEVLVTNDHNSLHSEHRQKMDDLIEESQVFEREFTICSFKNNDSCEINHPLMLRKILKSDDPNELLYYWQHWRDEGGKESVKNFKQFVAKYAKATKANKFDKPSDMFLFEFEDQHILDNLTATAGQLHEFFEELHAHVRFLLRQKYGSELVPEKAPIPEHLLEKFILETNLENPEIDYPFPNSPLTDIADVMRAQNYTPKKFFLEADEFFTSMDIPTALTADWEDYISLKEDEGCYPRAVTLFTKIGIGFFYCKEISFQNFLAVHSEMFKVQRDLQTKNLSLPYRVTRTDAFIDGLSDAVQLSVSSPAYLHKIGLIDNEFPDPEKRINFLYLMALRVMFQLRREFVGSKFYMELLNSKFPVERSNCDFWHIQEKYVGVQPPVERKDTDFDFISIIYEDFNTDLVNRVFSKIISYKLYEGLCKKSGKYVAGSPDKPLDNCDFSGSKEAGKALSDLIKEGSRKKWQDLMLYITEDNDLDASSLLKYFEPLRIWLADNNKKNNVDVGWEPANKCKRGNK